MINYFRMKRKEWLLKLRVYTFILDVLNNQKEIVEIGKRLYGIFQDTSVDDLQGALITELATIIHKENEEASEEINEE